MQPGVPSVPVLPVPWQGGTAKGGALPDLAALELLGGQGRSSFPTCSPSIPQMDPVPKPSAGFCKSAGPPGTGLPAPQPLLTPGPSRAQPVPDRAWRLPLFSISAFFF